MKCLRTVSVAAVMTLLAPVASAQINNADAAGYLARARAMLDDNNTLGCKNQIATMKRLNPSEAQLAEAEFLLAAAAVRTSDVQGRAVLQGWIEAHPASPLVQEAKLLLGNAYFNNGEYATALDTYNQINASSFAAPLRQNLLFHKAYSLLSLGDKGQAARLFESMTANGEYRAARDFYLGYISYSDGDYASAISSLQAVESDREYGAPAKYYIAQIKFAQHNYAQAFESAKEVLASGAVPEYAPEANRIAGESLFNLGKESEAIPYLRNYAATAGEDILPSAAYVLGVSEYHSHDYGAAAVMFKKVTDCDDAMGQSASLYLGQCYVREDNTDGALMAFEKAYKMSFDKAVAEEALYNYAVARANGGRLPFANSVALFENFLSLYPQSKYAPEVQRYILSGYMSDNDYESVLRVVNAMRNPSRDALLVKQRALFMTGVRQYAAGDITAASGSFKQAVEAHPSDASVAQQALLWEGTCLYDNNSYERAAQCFRQYLRNAPSGDANALLARYNLAYSLFGAEKFDDALGEFKKVLASSPKSDMKSDAFNRAGDCLYYKSDFAGASAEYAKAYESNPQSGDYALYQQALMKGLQRDYKSKIAGLDNMMRQFPNSALAPAALLEKAESYASMGESGKSVAVYNELTERYSETAYGRKGMLQLAITYQNQGQGGKATETYKGVITRYPTSEEARLASDDLKRIYADAGNLQAYAAFMASVPGAPSVDSSELDGLAFSAAEAEYIESDKTDRLLRYIKDFPKGAHEAQALYYLADAASSAGNDSEALRYASQLLESYPDASAAEDALLIKAESELTLGKGELALESYRNLARKATGARNTREANLGLMRTALQLGENTDVISAADALLATTAGSQSDMSEIKYSKALALERTGDRQHAYDIWRTLAEDSSDVYGARSAVALAESMLENGDSEGAKSVADKLINSNTPHSYWLARGFIVLSDALRAQGDTFEADEYLKSLKANYPGAETDIFEMIDKRLK
ncbi:MAG: tetratricopeptide repeat protein [Paramuribaculum sp.]|nr:tetratricopeptide repeat protein [Paramuribaculum sp.]